VNFLDRKIPFSVAEKDKEFLSNLLSLMHYSYFQNVKKLKSLPKISISLKIMAWAFFKHKK